MIVHSFFKLTSIVAVLLFIVGGTFSLHAQDKLDDARIAFSNKDYLEAAELYKKILREKAKDEDILVEAGDVYMALELYDTAQDFYQRAYNQDSRDGVINRKLGTALSLLGEHDQAIEKLRRAFKYDDESLETRLALANGFLRIGTDSLEKAEIAILQANTKFPDNPYVQVALGNLYFERDVYELSETYYTKAIELDPSLIEARIRLAISLRERGKRTGDVKFYENALEQCIHVTSIAPKEPVPWRLMGEILFLARKYEDALNALEQYMALRPDDPEGDFLFAVTAAEGQYFTEAIEPAKRILSRNDARSKRFHAQAHTLVSRGYYSKGQAYKGQEKVDSARIFYRMATEAYGNAPDSVLDANDFVYHGTSWMWQGDTVRGIQVWNSMIHQFPDSCAFGFTLSKAIFSYGRHEDALASLDNLESVCGENFDPSIPMFRGLLYLRLDQKEKAIAAYDEAIKLDSTNVDAYYRLLNTMVGLKQFENIPAIVDRMSVVVPVQENEEALAWCYYFKGIALFNNKELEDAIASFEKATELKNDHSQAYLYIAVCYHTLKDKENACVNYQKVLQYDPENAYAKENIGKLGC